MRFKVNFNGYSAITKDHLYKGLTVHKTKGAEIISGKWASVQNPIIERWEKYHGLQGIIRKVWYKRFWHYEICYASIYFPDIAKTIWIDVDCLEFTGVNVHAV